jgi:rRNA maturation protein Nop10
VKVFDFLCRDCSTLHEEFVDSDARYDDRGEACPMCGGETRAVPVPPKVAVATAMPGFERGKSSERPGPAAFDTKPLADGRQNITQWKKARSKMWRDRQRAKDLGHRDKLTFRR